MVKKYTIIISIAESILDLKTFGSNCSELFNTITETLGTFNYKKVSNKRYLQQRRARTAKLGQMVSLYRNVIVGR